MADKPLEIVVGVAGSIAAYKAADVVSTLKKRGANVTVLMTAAARHFVTPLVLKTLSGRPVGDDLHNEPDAWGVGHVSLARQADAYVIVGATADLMAKLAQGLAGDFVTAVALVARCPLILAPAMHTEMWDHAATRKNAEVLLEQGWHFVGPVEGALASGDSGMGRLADPERIAEETLALAGGGLKGSGALEGKRLLITAGPTREALDPVRYLSNPSSGRMGFALARAAQRRGAKVVLVSGPVSLNAPRGVQVVPVVSAVQMLEACQKHWKECDVFIAAAAVSDFRPAQTEEQKVKKEGAPVELKLAANPDILATLAAEKGGRVVVGYAAETQDLVANAQAKVKAKNLDFIVANPVGEASAGFGASTNRATLLWADGRSRELPTQSKSDMAEILLNEIETLLKDRGA